MPNISTYSTSDKIVFITVSDEWVVSAPASLDTVRLLQLTATNITCQLSAHV